MGRAESKLNRWYSRFVRRPGSLRRVGVVAAAVALSGAALGFLVWFLLTRSASRQAWQVSLATVLAVVVPSFGMSVAMLAWVLKSRLADVRGVRGGDADKRDVMPMPRLRMLTELDPFDLEVHRPVEVETAEAIPVLPRYVPREHDTLLRKATGQAAGGQSQLAVVVGGSSTGKTRACWEALHSLRDRHEQWHLWHPIDPTRPDAVLAGLGDVVPHTVVWLNEAQLYLDTHDEAGERVAAGLRELLRDKARGPVLVLATLWPEHWDTLTTRAEPDRHAQARELLVGHKIDVPASFSAVALSMLALEAISDPRLAQAAAEASDGQITQYLAGVPVLLDRYQQSPPGAKALVHAAMDARRLGCSVHLPLDLLAAAASGYLTGQEWDQLDDTWLEQALAYASRLCNGIRGPLTRVRIRDTSIENDDADSGAGPDDSPSYRLADYLDQYGRRNRRGLIPPSSFWAAAPKARLADLATLGVAAHNRGLLRVSAQLNKQAAHRDAGAACRLISGLQRCCPGDLRPVQWTAEHAALDSAAGVNSLFRKLLEAEATEQVEALLTRDPAGQVDLDGLGTIALLLDTLRAAGAQDQASALADRAATQASLDRPGDISALVDKLREMGNRDQLRALLARDPAARVTLDDLEQVALLLGSLRAAGSPEQVNALADRAVKHTTSAEPRSIAWLLGGLREIGARDQAIALADRTVTVAGISDLYDVAFLLGCLRVAGTQEQLIVLADRVARHATLNHSDAVAFLLRRLRTADALEQADILSARIGAEAALNDAGGVASLLGSLRAVGAQEQVAGLLARDPAAHTALNDAGGIASLLGSLRAVGAQEQVAGLLARNPAAHVVLDDPRATAYLLGSLRAVGAQEQVAGLLARNPAAHVVLDEPYAIAWLLVRLREVGAQGQVTTLADRAATYASMDDPRAVALLLRSMRIAGAQKQATLLVERLPGEGLFDLFSVQGVHGERYLFGREPNGSPGPPWTWDDLDLPQW
jgi:uncharacterized protein YidB (DUF937 family)